MSSALRSNAPQPGNSKLRIAVATHGNGFSGADGTAPLIYAYNEDKDFLPDIVVAQQADVLSDSVLPWEILSHVQRTDSDGKHHKRNMPSAGKPGGQTTYLQLSATDNAIRIAYLSQTWTDGTQRGWPGDVSESCNKDRYYSTIIVGESHRPTCLWIDTDHTNDICTSKIQIYMQAITNTADTATSKDPAVYCKPPSMEYYHDNPPATWDLRSTPLLDLFAQMSPRNVISRDLRIISSPHDVHSAPKLCGSATSKGPDFVSVGEGIYCDMTTISSGRFAPLAS